MAAHRRLVVVLVVVAALVLGLVAVTVGRRVWDATHRSDLSRALGVVPASTARLSFTDWAEVRRALDVSDSDEPTAADIEEMTGRAYDRDLSAVSSIDESAAALQEHFGFSPATAEWEAFAQSTEGATMVVRMPDDADLDAVTDNLAELGFTEPSQETGVWRGGVDLVAKIDPTITPELQYVAVLADERLVVTSDTESYAEQVVGVVLGDGDSLADVDGTRDVADAVGDPVAAMLWADDFACRDLAMSQADDVAQQRAEQLVADAGGVSPLSGLVMALQPDRDLLVAELFEDAGQARDDLRARARLAVGEAPGRGGSFSDELRLVSSRTDGAAVLLELRPKQDEGFVLSALDNGPVLFATC